MKYLKKFESVWDEYEETVKVKEGDIYRFAYPDGKMVSLECLYYLGDEDDEGSDKGRYRFRGYKFRPPYYKLISKSYTKLSYFAVEKDDIPSKTDIDAYIHFAEITDHQKIKELHNRRDEIEKEYNVSIKAKTFDL